MFSPYLHPQVQLARMNERPISSGGVKHFTYDVSLSYEKDSQCKKPDNKHPLVKTFIKHHTLRKPIGVCTTNVIGDFVIFECDGKGVILEHVYGTKDCSGPKVRTMPIKNGCNEYSWGAMLMEWDGKEFCGAKPTVTGKPLTSKGSKCVLLSHFFAEWVFLSCT